MHQKKELRCRHTSTNASKFCQYLYTMWKGIKEGRKSDRQLLLRNGRVGRWVAFKLSVFSCKKASTFFFFFSFLPLSFPPCYNLQTLCLLMFLFGHSKPWRIPHFFFPLSWKGSHKKGFHVSIWSHFFFLLFSFKLNWKGFGLFLIVELNK